MELHTNAKNWRNCESIIIIIQLKCLWWSYLSHSAWAVGPNTMVQRVQYKLRISHTHTQNALKIRASFLHKKLLANFQLNLA